MDDNTTSSSRRKGSDIRRQKMKLEWDGLVVGSECFSIKVSEAEREFLDRSVISVETKDNGTMARLVFRGGFDGPWFDPKDDSLTFKKICKGAFK